MNRFFLLSFLVSASAFSLFAQEAGSGPPPGMPMDGMHGGGPRSSHEFGRSPFGPHPGKVVTGAPYSATVSNTSVEHLADGNTIQRTTTGQVARDSVGRSYEQQTITGGPLADGGSITVTFISDPVAGYSYNLNSKTKVAMRHELKSPPDGSGARGPHSGGNALGTHQGSGEVAEADLGADSSSGVTAQGKKVTHTIPANAIGNAQPITSTSERWYSNDLQIVVKAIRNDPRFGQSTYALTNVVTKEPDASLFKVPSDYTVQDAPQRPGRF